MQHDDSEPFILRCLIGRLTRVAGRCGLCNVEDAIQNALLQMVDPSSKSELPRLWRACLAELNGKERKDPFANPEPSSAAAELFLYLAVTIRRDVWKAEKGKQRHVSHLAVTLEDKSSTVWDSTLDVTQLLQRIVKHLEKSEDSRATVDIMVVKAAQEGAISPREIADSTDQSPEDIYRAKKRLRRLRRKLYPDNSDFGDSGGFGWVVWPSFENPNHEATNEPRN